jgi:hypothetical protein
MELDKTVEEQLWDYIDGSILPHYREAIESKLRTDAVWQQKYRELLEVHQLMTNHIELDQPSMRFTQNVMEHIAQHQIAPATVSYLNRNIIFGIGGFFGLMILGLVVYIFGQIEWSQDSPSSGVASEIRNFDWSRIFNNSYVNLLLMLSVVLGLILLDYQLSAKKKKAGMH